jgi:hypothetical protein
MKRLAVALGASLLMVTVVVAPVLGAAQKVALVPCADEYQGTCAPNLEPLGGGGFAIFNNSAGAGHNLLLTVALKKVLPETDYDIYLFVDDIYTGGSKVGTVTTNAVGNATFHINTLVPLGERLLAVDVTYAGSGSDVF